MTAIAAGDVNATYTLECAHRQQVLAARALNEPSLLIRGLPFLRTKTIGDVYIDGEVTLSILQFSDVHVGSSPIEVQRSEHVNLFSMFRGSVGQSCARSSNGPGDSQHVAEVW